MKEHSHILMEILPEGRLTRITDVGANPVNEPPYAALHEAGLTQVWGFEPGEAAYQALLDHPRPNETYFPVAVGDGGAGELKITRGDGFSSLLEPDQDTLGYLGRWKQLMKVVKRVPVETSRLDDLETLPHCDLLKIDIQGGEVAAFRNGRNHLSDAVAVISEVAFVALYEGQPLLDEQMRELAGQGFILHKFLHQTARPLVGAHTDSLQAGALRNQLIDGDAVFIRDLRKPDLVSDEQLRHLAILADGVFASFDLTLRCLDLLAERGLIGPEAIAYYAEALPMYVPQRAQAAH